MNDLVMRVRGSLWWLLPIAVFVVLLGLETDWGRAVYVHLGPEEPVAAKPVVVSLLPEYKIDGGTASHNETVARTLFNPTRRPAPIAVVEVKKPVIQRGQFALTGTTVAGERSLAFLREVSGGKARTVKLGDTINGMVVADVKSDRVKLTLNDESEELVLKVVANPRPTPQPAAAAPPAPGQPPGQPPPGQPGGAQPAPGTPEVSQSLAERRRAARAAEAAAAATQQNDTSMLPQSGQPALPVSPPAGQQAPAQPPQQTGTTGQPDNGWAAVFQRYQQRRN